MKIFKYTIKDGSTMIPANAKILRIDHVDDGFYLGDFLWAIVDPAETQMQQFNWDGIYYSAAPHVRSGLEKIPLKVKEKQTVTLNNSSLVCAGEDDGTICLWARPAPVHEVVDIVVYKTGQQIDIPIEKLEYLGLNRLWIIQELGLYTFRVKS